MKGALLALFLIPTALSSAPHHGKSVKIVFFKGTEGFKYKAELARDIEKRLQLPVFISQKHPELPPSAYSSKKNMWNARPLLTLLTHLRRDVELVLGILNVLLYSERVHEMFGSADVQRGVALVSLVPLKDEFYGKGQTPPRLFYRRVLTECVHELGHLLSLPHCDNVHCVMHFSNSLVDTDIKRPDFCPKCLRKLRKLRIY